jgi:hypothetical protein
MRWLLPLLTGCGPSSSVFVGEVAETDAVVGMALDDEGGQLYLCGGSETMASLNRWFEVSVQGDTLSGSADGWTVQAQRAEQTERAAWSGQLASPEGDSWAFVASEGGEPDGPYIPEEDVGDCPAGAVVLDGGERLQGVVCPAGLAPAQVVPVGIIADRSGRIPVRTEHEPPLEFVVVPVGP